MNRRAFLKSAAAAALPTTPVLGAAYGLFEAGWIQIERPELPLPNLPRAFDGLRVAFLTDIHHGPYTSLDHVVAVVRTAMKLRPDLILLGGDYSLKDAKFIAPCFEVLAALSAPHGVFGVLGDHDYRHGPNATRAGMKAAGVTELTNRGLWIERSGSRFWLGGVDDLWWGKPNAAAALGEATRYDGVLLVSHNPDFAETMQDRRVGLMLSGHTHGGQAVVPGIGAPFVPSRYGAKYLKGRIAAPTTTVYVSRGLGTSITPLRYGSRPELTLLTLRST